MFNFEYKDGKVTYSAKVDEVTWPEALQTFVDFVSKVYGYDISSEVAIIHWPNSDKISTEWTGPIYSPDGELLKDV